MMCLRFTSRMVPDVAMASYVGFKPGLTGLVKALASCDAYVEDDTVNTRCR